MLQRCAICSARHSGDPVCLVVGVGRACFGDRIAQLCAVSVYVVFIGRAKRAVLVNSGQTV